MIKKLNNNELKHSSKYCYIVYYQILILKKISIIYRRVSHFIFEIRKQRRKKIEDYAKNLQYQYLIFLL